MLLLDTHTALDTGQPVVRHGQYSHVRVTEKCAPPGTHISSIIGSGFSSAAGREQILPQNALNRQVATYEISPSGEDQTGLCRVDMPGVDGGLKLAAETKHCRKEDPMRSDLYQERRQVVEGDRWAQS